MKRLVITMQVADEMESVESKRVSIPLDQLTRRGLEDLIFAIKEFVFKHT